MYADQFSSLLMPDLPSSSNTELIDTTVGELFGQGDDDGLNMYYTHPVRQFAPQLLEHISEWEDLFLTDRFAPAGVGMVPYVSAWFGSGSGVTTQAHYDIANNAFAQIHGEKRFRIYPPDAVRQLHMFPDAHPRARKSQVDLDAPDKSIFPDVASLPPPYLDVVLQPGDVLEIPAFWVHHVEAQGTSVSLNVFSESGVRLGAASCLHSSVPVDANAGAALGESARRLRSVVWQVLQRVGEEPSSFVNELYASRYAPLYADGRDVYGDRKGLLYDETREAFPDGQCAQDSFSDSPDPHSTVDAEAEFAFADIEAKFCDMLSRFSSDDKDWEGIRLVIASHLVELWAVRAVGAPRLTPGFWRMLATPPG